MNAELLVPVIFVVLLALSIHEFAHAKMADLAGDPTPSYHGRVTLNPMSHLDPMGTIMIVLTTLMGFGLGWAKPVPMNAQKMRNPRWDFFAAVAAGPLSNLLQAILFAVGLRLSGVMGTAGFDAIVLGQAGIVNQLFLLGMQVNIALFLFNLVPLGPLDGHWMVGTFMGESTRAKWYLWNRQVGTFVLLALVIGGQLVDEINVFGRVLRPLMDRISLFLLGA